MDKKFVTNIIWIKSLLTSGSCQRLRAITGLCFPWMLWAVFALQCRAQQVFFLQREERATLWKPFIFHMFFIVHTQYTKRSGCVAKHLSELFFSECLQHIFHVMRRWCVWIQFYICCTNFMRIGEQIRDVTWRGDVIIENFIENDRVYRKNKI